MALKVADVIKWTKILAHSVPISAIKLELIYLELFRFRFKELILFGDETENINKMH